MKRSLLLLTLMPLCLLADSEGKEVKKIWDPGAPRRLLTPVPDDSVTYQQDVCWPWKNNITIVKMKNPISVTYSQTPNQTEITLFGQLLTCTKDGKRVSYTKNRRTKEITVSIDENAMTSYTTRFFIDSNATEKEKKELRKLLKAIFITEKHKASAKENQNE